MRDDANPLPIQKRSRRSEPRDLGYSHDALMAGGIAAIAIGVWYWRQLIDSSLDRLSSGVPDRGEIIFRNEPLPAPAEP